MIRDTEKCPLSILRGLIILQNLRNKFFVGINKTDRYILVSVERGCTVRSCYVPPSLNRKGRRLCPSITFSIYCTDNNEIVTKF